jgi:hypothetical protein
MMTYAKQRQLPLTKQTAKQIQQEVANFLQVAIRIKKDNPEMNEPGFTRQTINAVNN